MGIWVHGGVSHVVSVFEKGCKKVSWCVGLEEHFSAWLANVVLQKEGSHYTLRPSAFMFSNHPSFHAYFNMFLWPHTFATLF